ncbi:MAG: peptide MFS transporter [Pseudomonadales bacterium]|nr:peptide MFS transporter [Pseudomonadales bacterium]MBO6563347.1 peptide MFS transporter [Pseudomonadales bacterium]MBO6597848.1 peptide MFS transporter [Pseudomonadales bacterium]MBO6702330.1 peptide MFS transporter [Pseudomonadales bacterium]MBO6824256.1 peptide MFS transporter [Pseudomonadales bacterium]
MSTAVTPAEEILGHPKGLFVLFMTEMWERFSYYGMRALLILYLTKHFLFGDREAGLLYGSYGSLVYAMPVIGGLIADRYLGYKKAIMFGAMLLVLGHFGMAFEGPPSRVIDGEVVRETLYEQIFYLSLALIIVGVGFLKASISTIVGQLYEEHDPRRDAGFTIFYMGINIGAFIATLACAYLGETYGWRYGFGLAGIGMLVGLVTFIGGDKHLQGVGAPPATAGLSDRIAGVSKEVLIYISAFAAVVVVWQLIQRTGDLGILLTVFGSVVVAWVVWYSLSKCTPIERDRMLTMLLLIVLSVFFWALFEQAGSSLTLFTDRNVNMGEIFTAGMFQSLNPMFIIMFAPVFAWIWVKLAQKKKEPSTPMKFGLGILQVGLGFVALIIGASFAGEDGKVAVFWLALMYLLHTTGELCLSPVGLSMVTRLSVAQVGGIMMGVWFLSSAFATYVAGMIAGAMAIGSDGADVSIGLESLSVYVGVFEKLAILAVSIGILLMIVSPWLAKKMHLER